MTDASVPPLSSPLKKSIRAASGPCGRITALHSLPESPDSTRSRVLSSATMTRPRLQSDFFNGLLGACRRGFNEAAGLYSRNWKPAVGVIQAQSKLDQNERAKRDQACNLNFQKPSNPGQDITLALPEAVQACIHLLNNPLGPSRVAVLVRTARKVHHCSAGRTDPSTHRR